MQVERDRDQAQHGVEGNGDYCVHRIGAVGVDEVVGGDDGADDEPDEGDGAPRPAPRGQGGADRQFVPAAGSGLGRPDLATAPGRGGPETQAGREERHGAEDDQVGSEIPFAEEKCVVRLGRVVPDGDVAARLEAVDDLLGAALRRLLLGARENSGVA